MLANFNGKRSATPTGGGSNCDLLLEPEFELRAIPMNSDDTFTVQQAINNCGFGTFQVKLSLKVGLCWMLDSMEMSLLSILGPAMSCEWQVPKFYQALMTSVVFLGMLLSSSFWTKLSDRYGRKPALTLCGILLILYSLLSSVAPSFVWLIILRALVGFAIGCVPQSYVVFVIGSSRFFICALNRVTLYAEFLPTNHKEKCVALMDCFWALGACFEITLALIVFPQFGWRWLLGLSATPLLLFTILTPWLTESPRFYALNGRTDKAVRVLEQIAKDNGRQMPAGRLIADGELNASGNVQSVLRPGLRRTTILLWFVWMSCGFCYYGLVLLSTEWIVLTSSNSNTTDGVAGTAPGAADCVAFTTKDFMDLLWITLSEFPGILFTITTIKRLGKRLTMVSQFLVFTACIVLLSLSKSRLYSTTVLFVARGVISGLFQAAYVYTPEVYPTTLRSIGVIGCSTVARLGAMAAPFVAQMLLPATPTLVLIYAGVGLLAAVACAMLPQQNSGNFVIDAK